MQPWIKLFWPMVDCLDGKAETQTLLLDLVHNDKKYKAEFSLKSIVISIPDGKAPTVLPLFPTRRSFHKKPNYSFLSLCSLDNMWFQDWNQVSCLFTCQDHQVGPDNEEDIFKIKGMAKQAKIPIYECKPEKDLNTYHYTDISSLMSILKVAMDKFWNIHALFSAQPTQGTKIKWKPTERDEPTFVILDQPLNILSVLHEDQTDFDKSLWFISQLTK